MPLIYRLEYEEMLDKIVDIPCVSGERVGLVDMDIIMIQGGRKVREGEVVMVLCLVESLLDYIPHVI